MNKRLFSLLLALLLCLSLAPVAAFAASDETVGEPVEEVARETKPEQTAVEKVQAMLDALPTVEELEAAEEATVNAAYEAAQAAYDALEALNPEEQEQITGAEKLMTLMKWFNEKTSMTDGVEYNHNNVHGIEPGKTYCGDTYFTVDIPAEHLVQVSYYHRASGTYPVLTPDEDGRYKLDAGLGEIDVCVFWKNRIDLSGSFMLQGITINADHVDIDKDHNCDNGCGKTVGTHEDADLNHICDYGCKEAIGVCADADKDHKCDYGCGKTFGVCSGGTATCKDKAVCDYCGKPYGEVNKSNHVGGTEVRNAKDATCTEDGYTGDTYCKGCETKLQEGKPITKLGHIDADKNHVCDRENCKATLSTCSGGTATCKDKAVCDYCGEPYGEVDSSNHAGSTEVRNAKDASCTEDGYTGDTYCKGCETKLSSGKSVDKTGHDYESKVTKEATTTSTGTKTYTCKNCGHSYEEEIAKLTPEPTATPAPTAKPAHSPKTGDEANVMLWLGLGLSAALALGYVGVRKKEN